MPLDIEAIGDSITVMCNRDINPGCLLMYSYVASDGCRYQVYDTNSTCVKEQVIDAIPGEYSCGGGFVVDDNTSCITFSANTALSKSTDLLISEVITGVDNLEDLVKRLDTYKVKEQDYQDIINLYLEANGGGGSSVNVVVDPTLSIKGMAADAAAVGEIADNVAYASDEDPEASTVPVDADTLGGKTEGMLSVAKAVDADKLGGQDASRFMQNGDVTAKAGFIYPLATPDVPDGFLLCDGQAYSRAEYSELFEAIGTYYGEGDGSTTFNVPNLQTRVPVGAGSGYALGDVGGEATHTLTEAEMPIHAHTINQWTNDSGGSGVGGGYVPWHTSPGGGHFGTDDAGGNQPHNNMQPYTVVNYIIATGKGSNVNVRDIITGAQAIPLGIEYGGTDATSADDARNNLGLGAVATESIVPVAKGGTGATDAATARANLGAVPSVGTTKRHFADHGGTVDGALTYYSSIALRDLGNNKYYFKLWGKMSFDTAASTTNYRYGVDTNKVLATINGLYGTDHTAITLAHSPYVQIYKSDGTPEIASRGYGFTATTSYNYWNLARFYTTEGTVGGWDQNLLSNRIGGYGYVEFEGYVQCS